MGGLISNPTYMKTMISAMNVILSASTLPVNVSRYHQTHVIQALLVGLIWFYYLFCITNSVPEPWLWITNDFIALILIWMYTYYKYCHQLTILMTIFIHSICYFVHFCKYTLKEGDYFQKVVTIFKHLPHFLEMFLF